MPLSLSVQFTFATSLPENSQPPRFRGSTRIVENRNRNFLLLFVFFVVLRILLPTSQFRRLAAHAIPPATAIPLREPSSASTVAKTLLTSFEASLQDIPSATNPWVILLHEFSDSPSFGGTANCAARGVSPIGLLGGTATVLCLYRGRRALEIPYSHYPNLTF
ncbi:hypothetical protein K438DRAFT_1965326 [Mycena galopus ATCC 62051]|nr:hypothetical protein K438DRAFT_1965326 [Mycena galopus ATCC 62051]